MELCHITFGYPGRELFRDFSLRVEPGERVILTGASGRGKTTLLRLMAGLEVPREGAVRGIPAGGVSMVFQENRLFPGLTVLENLKIGAYMRKDSLDEDLNWVHDLFPRLKERSWQLAGTLSGGEQQMLAIGRALMSKPELIMMDEPSLGLAPIIVQGVFDIIKEINKQGVTILLVEQNANMALKAADLGYVMETGQITLSGTGKELAENEEVKAAYLGKAKS